jgi:hypothetical protein
MLSNTVSAFRPAGRYDTDKGKRLRQRSGCGLRYTGRGPHNKHPENHRGKHQGVARS